MEKHDFIRNPHLEGDDFYMPGNSIGILLIHGFTATTAEVRLMADKLHQSGFTTAGPLLPGHGTHPDDLNRATWPMWVEKVKSTYETLLENSREIFVIGESMGAVLAIELAAQHPEIAGLMLFAPAIKVRNLWLSGVLSLFKPYLEKSDEDDGLLWKGYNVYPYKAAHQMYLMQKHCRKILPKITHPTQVYTGEFDKAIAPESAQIILKGIQSNYKCQIHMPQSSHCILLDRELNDAHQFILDFIRKE